jgi:hypothetical protein
VPNFADQNKPFPPPSPDEYGLYVRPIFSGSDPSVLTVQLASGSSLNIGGISGSFGLEQPTSASFDAVPVSTTAVTIAATNANRLGMTIKNDSNRVLFIRFGPGVTTSAYAVEMRPRDLYELPFPCYTGLVTGIWASAGSGNALVQELVR